MVFFVIIGLTLDYLYFDLWSEGGPSWPIATTGALTLSTVSTVVAYYGGSSLILASLGAEALDMQIPEHRELRNIVTEMALASGSPMPKVLVIFDPAPNAFATGTNERNAAICVTTGLLALLDREETQGVVAHEIAHIRNEDIIVMTLVSVLLGGIAILADWGQHGFYTSRANRKFGKSPWLFLPALVLIAFSPLVARLLAMVVSRQREYLADSTAVEFTRNPRGLAGALEKIRDAAMPFHKATRGTAHLFIANPLRRRVDDRDGRVADLLSSHPPIQRRIDLLYRMAGARPSAALRQAS